MRVTVKDVMSVEVASVNGSTPFKDIAEVLIHHQISAVPVVDGEGHVIGVVSEADLLRKEEFREQYYREGYTPPLRTRLRHRLAQDGANAQDRARGDTAAELMTRPPITVGPTGSIVTAMRLMDEHGVKRLPVVDDDGVLQGIVSRHDVLKVFVRSDADLAREIQDDILDRALWVDTSGVRVQVKQGVVTLGGQLPCRSDAQITARMTSRVNGVVDVVDHLTWKHDDTTS